MENTTRKKKKKKCTGNRTVMEEERMDPTKYTIVASSRLNLFRKCILLHILRSSGIIVTGKDSIR